MKLVQAGTHTPEQAIEAWRRSTQRLGLLFDRSAHYNGKRLSVSLGEAIKAKHSSPTLGSTFGELPTEVLQAKRRP